MGKTPSKVALMERFPMRIPNESQVRELAFCLWQQRGCRTGHAEEDWRDAALMLGALRQSPAATSVGVSAEPTPEISFDGLSQRHRAHACRRHRAVFPYGGRPGAARSRARNGVPAAIYIKYLLLQDGDDALLVGWCEPTSTDAPGRLLYRNARATSRAENAVATGRSRWKIENENNNALKTKG